jgi:WD40 repeat protein/transcriptional regulator with XRE-family HTH domain
MPRPERPVDPAEGAIQEFAVALRELREQAGGPTYRSLADRTGLSVSTLADAAGGRRLPTFAVAVAYAVACGGDEQEWAARWRAVAEGQVAPQRAPYRGMAGFRGEDADLFFGRERLVAQLVERVREHPVTVVLGASGAGKSSLLAAGLVPALNGLRPLIVTPGEHPADRLPDEADDTVLVIDQFEELYTLCAADERASFLDRLLARSRGRVVLSVRADYFGRCAEHPGLAEVLRDNQVLVGPMTQDELREAMTKPAAAVGLSVERALVATVVQEAKGRAGVLPLLSHAMLETWRKRRGTVLTLAGFQSAGGIDGAVLRTAEETYGAFDSAQRALAAELLPRMLSIDESVARRRVDLADVLSVDPGAVAVIEALADARLVTVDGGTVEIAHDAMLTAWPRLRAWIDDHRDAVRAHRKISEAARIWVESDRDPSALASGGRLELMKAHSSALTGVLRLSQVEKDFLEQSDLLATRTALAVRRRTVRQRLLVLAAVVAVVVAATFAAVADAARTDALAARDIALSQQIASTVQTLRVTDPAVAAQLSIAGYREAPTSEARSTLLESTGAPIPARYLGAGSTALAASHDGALVAVSDATDGSVSLFTRSQVGLSRAGVITAEPTGPDRPVSSSSKVYALTFAPHDHVLAVGDGTATVTLWDVSDPHEPKRLSWFLSGGAGPIAQLAFDATGAELAAAGGERVGRWAVTDPEHPHELAVMDTGARVRSVAYSPAGDRLAFGTDAGTAHVWTLGAAPGELTVLESQDKPLMVAFAPNGQLMMRAKEQDAIQLWDVSRRDPVEGPRLDALTDVRVTTTDFSADGRYLVVTGADSTAYVLETRTWTLLRALPHPDIVTSAAFTGDGAAVVTAATDGALRWWGLRSAMPTRALAPIGDLGRSGGGGRLAVFAEGDISVWDNGVRVGPRLRGLFSGAGDLSEDGRWLAAGTVDGAVLLYDLTDPQHPVSLGATGKKVEAVAFSADGGLLAAGGEDTSVRVWDLKHPGTPPAVFSAPEDRVLDLNWRHAGRHLAVASADGHVYLLDLTDPAAPRQEAVVGGANGYSATFSEDGALLAVGGADGVRLWDVTDPGAPRQIGAPVTGPTSRILDLSVNRAKSKLAASLGDGTVWLWNITDPAHPSRSAVLAETGSPLNAVAFQPTGDMLVAGGGDRAVHRWRTDESSVIAKICAGVGDPITPREWRTHLPGVPYDPPCR